MPDDWVLTIRENALREAFDGWTAVEEAYAFR
jgi:hypothetical protein